MPPNAPIRRLSQLLTIMACAVVLRTTVLIVSNYGDYFPANFRADFLLGRQDYFYGVYAGAFYPHIVAGPVTLLLGLALVVDASRGRPSRWHRPAGKLQAALVLAVICPSGLVMACWAPGVVHGLGLGALAVATGGCVAMGWRAAVKRRFAQHRRWMQRTYALLVSAVVLRAMGGLAQVLAIEGMTTVSAWASWLLPLVVLELARLSNRRVAQSPHRPQS